MKDSDRSNLRSQFREAWSQPGMGLAMRVLVGLVVVILVLNVAHCVALNALSGDLRNAVGREVVLDYGRRTEAGRLAAAVVTLEGSMVRFQINMIDGGSFSSVLHDAWELPGVTVTDHRDLDEWNR